MSLASVDAIANYRPLLTIATNAPTAASVRHASEQRPELQPDSTICFLDVCKEAPAHRQRDSETCEWVEPPGAWT